MPSNEKTQKTLLRQLRPWFDEYKDSYLELMAYYKCALMEVETKFNVLNEEYSLLERNPIESIKTRIKSLDSIAEKLDRRGYDLTVDSIERNLDDVAGIRIICSFPSDVYDLADALLNQDDIILIQKKDYMKEPKPNGYRSLHLIIAVPIFLHDQKKMMTVEVQLRTMGMDWWASLEHKITYKKNIPDDGKLRERLLDCAKASFDIDSEMEKIYNDSLVMRGEK